MCNRPSTATRPQPSGQVRPPIGHRASGLQGTGGSACTACTLQPVSPPLTGRAGGKHAAAKEPSRLDGWWLFGMRKGIVGPWCLASAVRGGGGMQYWFGVTKAGGWRGRGMAVALDATTGPDITLLLPRRCRSLLPLAFISSNCTPRKTVLDSTSSPGFHPLNIAVDNSVTPNPPPLQGYTRPTQRLKTTAGGAHDQGKTKATAII